MGSARFARRADGFDRRPHWCLSDCGGRRVKPMAVRPQRRDPISSHRRARRSRCFARRTAPFLLPRIMVPLRRRSYLFCRRILPLCGFTWFRPAGRDRSGVGDPCGLAPQHALERFPIPHGLFAGVAGGTDPSTKIGDVAATRSIGNGFFASGRRAVPTWSPPRSRRSRKQIESTILIVRV